MKKSIQLLNFLIKMNRPVHRDEISEEIRREIRPLIDAGWIERKRPGYVAVSPDAINMIATRRLTFEGVDDGN